VAKLVEVTVFKPTAGKMSDALATCAEVKSYLLKNGVDEVWYNTGTVAAILVASSPTRFMPVVR
jgi:hypothetical protein